LIPNPICVFAGRKVAGPFSFLNTQADLPDYSSTPRGLRAVFEVLTQGAPHRSVIICGPAVVSIGISASPMRPRLHAATQVK
jgi:hypothetical protein